MVLFTEFLKATDQCAKIKSLRPFSVADSQATEADIAYFAGHPPLFGFRAVLRFLA